MKVLVAEDSVLQARLLERTLQRLGHDVTAVEDGAAAWSLLQQQEFAIVISDWIMPHMDGLELCRRLRERQGSAYTYVMLLTAKDQREDRLEGMRAGADDFLVKPLDPAELTARLNVAQRILAMQTQLADTIYHLEIAKNRLAANSAALEGQKRALEEANAKLEALATTDGLTGLKNHRAFQERLAQEIHLGARFYLPLSVMMLDVDRFKQYNDAFGHPAGDQVLKALGVLLQSNARATDFVARYGGEEFVILMVGTDSIGAIELGERIRAAVERHRWEQCTITVSIGIASAEGGGENAHSLVDQADQAMYISKSLGRNCVSCYSDSCRCRTVS